MRVPNASPRARNRPAALMVASAMAALLLLSSAAVQASPHAGANATSSNVGPSRQSGMGGFVSYKRLNGLPLASNISREIRHAILALPPGERSQVLRHLSPALRAAVAANTRLRPDAVVPRDANGCNNNVCIDITGSGAHVAWWDTQAFGNAGCIYAHFLVNGGQISQAGPFCSNGQQGVYFDNWPADRWFNNGDQLCNTWSRISGKPCETIES
jgi:hypothetical protein